ncbi:MAG TPA: universal stress protein [Trebonia sp.]|jgi:nucleotide-binding universal stress UspA family protein|nr:universal stress protein [Trebonia sp.]
MSVPIVRRIVVGVDGSAESATALRWACREASLRGAEVYAVHAWEAPCHSVASYAVPVQTRPESDFDMLWRAVMPDRLPGVQVRTEVASGLAARVLLERSQGADMLVLGTAGDNADSTRSAGPVIRACLRRAPCPVVVISAAQDPLARGGLSGHPTDLREPVPAAAQPAAAGAPGHGRGLPVPAGACG